MEKPKYVQPVKRGDKVHLYFRKGDYREGPLQNPLGSEELRQEVQAILDRLAAKPEPAPVKGTVVELLKQYSHSAEFLTKARSTQIEYQRLIDEMMEQFEGVLLSDVTAAWLRNVRDAWVTRGNKAANDRRQVLKNVLMPATTDERIESDPFTKVGKVDRPHDAGESHPM